jgi:carboxyl-terminal processing protease
MFLLTASAFVGGAVTTQPAFAKNEADSPFSNLSQMARVLVLIENQYVDPVEQEKVLNGAIKGMVGELDPHSAYMPPRENSVFHSDTEGKFGGVGIQVELRDEKVIIIAPIEGSPAERAGIKSGDQIVAVNGERIHVSSLDKLIDKMRGDPGTTVDITIKQKGSRKTKTFRITREIIKVSSVIGKLLDHHIGYIRIKQFQRETHTEFLRTLGKIRNEGKTPLEGVVLDLRNNPGGLVDQATAIADEMLSSGTVFTTRQRGVLIEDTRASAGGALVKLPMVVLVNEYSASASELLAGALQDQKVATIVGAQTFGKGVVQTIFELPGGAGMRLTTMRYYTPSGRGIQAVGIKPDVVVEQKATPTPPDQIIRESDLEGSLPAETSPGHPKPTPPKVVKKPTSKTSTKKGSPGSKAKPGDNADQDEEFSNNFGVARNVPKNPEGGKDHVLSVGFQMLKNRISRTKK